MLTSESIAAKARDPGRRIGLGIGRERKKAEDSAAEAHRLGYGTVMLYDDPVRMARDLKNERLDAAVRGGLDANPAMSAVRQVFGVEKVLRAAFLRPTGGRMFLFAPVGIDEGWTVEEKVELIRLGGNLLRSMGIEPRVGILSGGRKSDKGRIDAVDISIEDALEVVKEARLEGFDAKHSEILIEDAAVDCDLIIAPDGISGNLIFRTLHFLGHGEALGAPVLNISRVYIDTSRAKVSYVDSLALASMLSGRV
jgi:putative methanogen marker protein 4